MVSAMKKSAVGMLAHIRREITEKFFRKFEVKSLAIVSQTNKPVANIIKTIMKMSSHPRTVDLHGPQQFLNISIVLRLHALRQY